MTVNLAGQDAAEMIKIRFPEAVMESDDQAVMIKSEFLLKVAGYLKDYPGSPFNYLTDLTAVDYQDYFEVVYRLTSLESNRSLVLKVHCYNRANPALHSVTSLWKGADFMEREILDLMGIQFEGHPNPTRLFMWEGFSGHPLRKDFL